MDQLLSEINTDHDLVCISALCHSVEDKVEFLSLKPALPLDEISDKFAVMMSTQSILFQEIWGRHMKLAATSVKRKEQLELTIEDIKCVIWDPTFTECKKLLDTLHDRSIKLAEVECYFRNSRHEDMTWQLRELSTSVHKCACADRPNNSRWIDGVVQHICDYQSLLTLSKAATIVLTLKTKLSLTGDFKAIETLAKEVCDKN